MKLSINSISLFAIALAVSVSSCKKDDDNTKAKDPGTVKLEFSNAVGTEPVTFNTKWYKNEHGDSFTVSKFNYYISNIRLNNNIGAVTYSEPESYHLVQQAEASSCEFDLTDVPAGTYNSITFLIGVDSARNVSGAQTGALDPANGMFWSWSTGYIMLKMEGTSPKSTATGNAVTIHIGGFSGPNSGLRTVTLPLTEPIEVNGDSRHVHLRADLLKLFKSPNIIDFATVNTLMSPSANSTMIADNYKTMFTVTAVE